MAKRELRKSLVDLLRMMSELTDAGCLSKADAAKQLSVSRAEIERMVRGGKIFVVGPEEWIPKSEIRRLRR